jgi:hypothetical protein
MKQTIRQFATLFTLCLILQAPIPRLAAQGRPQRQPKAQKESPAKNPPTAQEVRAHVLRVFQTDLSNRGRLANGWREAYKTAQGTIHVYVQRGTVSDIAFSPARTNSKVAVQALTRYAPTGHSERVDIETVVLSPNTEPSDDDVDACKTKLGRCILKNLTPGFWTAVGVAIGVYTGNVGLVVGAIIKEAEKDDSPETCVGEKCRKILGID